MTIHFGNTCLLYHSGVALKGQNLLSVVVIYFLNSMHLIQGELQLHGWPHYVIKVYICSTLGGEKT